MGRTRVHLGVVVASKRHPATMKAGELPAKTEGDVITYYAGAKFAENSRAPFQTADLCSLPQQIPPQRSLPASTKNHTNKK